MLVYITNILFDMVPHVKGIKKNNCERGSKSLYSVPHYIYKSQVVYWTFSNLFLHICRLFDLFLMVLVIYLSIPLLSFSLSLHLQFQRTSRHNA